MMALRQAPRLLIAIALNVVGSLVLGAGISIAADAMRDETTPAFEESQPCPACPAGVGLDSVRVVEDAGQTAFVFGGRFPAELAHDVRMVAGEVEVVAHPVRGGFRLTTLATGDGSLSAVEIGVGATRAELVMTLPTSAVTLPVRFEFGLWTGSDYAARLPREGRLEWDGKRISRLAPTTTTNVAPASSSAPTTMQPTTTTDSPATATTLISDADVPAALALAVACPSVPSGDVPASLEIERAQGITAEHPLTQKPARALRVEFAAAMADDLADRDPFAVVGIALPPGDGPPATGPAIDRVGTVQIAASWDGEELHKAIRRWNGEVWQAIEDDAATDLTIVANASAVTLFWPDLESGWALGYVTAAAKGCRGTGIAASS